ncbi:MAG: hypothetical protein LBB58_05875 [Cellulomonadaceae bacterium]|nr:hypothetical protein [Cellulomonadaceae bacterium]
MSTLGIFACSALVCGLLLGEPVLSQPGLSASNSVAASPLIVTLTGKPLPGEKLNAKVSLQANPYTYSYLWLRDGSVITGAVYSTYFVKPTDVGHELRVKVMSEPIEFAKPYKSNPKLVRPPELKPGTYYAEIEGNHRGRASVRLRDASTLVDFFEGLDCPRFSVEMEAGLAVRQYQSNLLCLGDQEFALQLRHSFANENLKITNYRKFTIGNIVYNWTSALD